MAITLRKIKYHANLHLLILAFVFICISCPYFFLVSLLSCLWLSFCRTKLEAFLLRSMEDGLVADGVIAQDISQASNFWRIREVVILQSILSFIPLLHKSRTGDLGMIDVVP
jgi:hypothetical protein